MGQSAVGFDVRTLLGAPDPSGPQNELHPGAGNKKIGLGLTGAMVMLAGFLDGAPGAGIPLLRLVLIGLVALTAWNMLRHYIFEVPVFEATPEGFRVRGGRLYPWGDLVGLHKHVHRYGPFPLQSDVVVVVRNGKRSKRKLRIMRYLQAGSAEYTLFQIERLVERAAFGDAPAQAWQGERPEVTAPAETAPMHEPWGPAPAAQARKADPVLPEARPAPAPREKYSYSPPADGGPIKSSRGLFKRKVI